MKFHSEINYKIYEKYFFLKGVKWGEGVEIDIGKFIFQILCDLNDKSMRAQV